MAFLRWIHRVLTDFVGSFIASNDESQQGSHSKSTQNIVHLEVRRSVSIEGKISMMALAS